LTDIETQILFDASPRKVFKALANPNNIPSFVPGIRAVDVVHVAPGAGSGTRVMLTTKHDHALGAEVVEEQPWKFLSLRDDRGVLNTWEIRETPKGTLVVNRIVGQFSPEERQELSNAARLKLYAFRDHVQSLDGATGT
jgi:uncharacterized protein YndB with AHSA1/START domain